MESRAYVRGRQVHPGLRLLTIGYRATRSRVALCGLLVGSAALSFAPGAPASAAGLGPLPIPLELASMTAEAKAALVVVAGLPAPRGVGGAIVFSATRDVTPPARTPIFVDQEGGVVKRYPGLPPYKAASAFRRNRDALRVGRATGAALRQVGVDVDLAPVLDASDGPLGSRHFRRPGLGIAFARGLTQGGTAPCVKHFPGLGSTPESTNVARVFGVVRFRELRAFRAAIRAGVPCVMVGHAIYPTLGKRRASLEPATYSLLRRQSFRGVAITDSLSALGPRAARWARLAVLAGADLVLVQEPRDVGRVIAALTPLARAGRLDPAVKRVIVFRRSLGFYRLP